ncbi:ROK family protein [Flexivirga caeni]|uniref:ROK family protein n=1 Tax=Flexivirga caeni TaxID=2294115 RepID=UPI0011CE599B|nr:ROK family protein [Flexivirga caeni]
MNTRLDLPAARQASALAVLAALRAGTSATAGELIESTQLSRPTVLNACDDLIRIGWVRELSASRRPGPGRPARSFSIDGSAGLVGGVDLGQSSINVAIADLRGAVIGESGGRLHPNASAATRIGAIQRHLLSACERAGVSRDRLASLTIGVAAPVLGDRISAQFGYLRDLPKSALRQTISAFLPHTTVELENDANLAALAERSEGAAVGETNLVALLAGERLGAGVITDGHLLHGARGAAGEAGAAGFLLGGSPDGAGRLVRVAAHDAAERNPHRYAALAERAAVAGGLTTADAFEIAATDRATQRLAVSALRPVARTIAALHLLLDPELVVICGAVAAAKDVVPLIQEALPDHVELTSRPARIVASPLGGRGVLIGALTLARHTVWRELGLADDPAPSAAD